MNDDAKSKRSHNLLEDQTLDRAQLETLAVGDKPFTLVRCDLEEVALSRLDLCNWTFDNCILRRAAFVGAKMEGSQWLGCRGGFADFTGSDLREARFEGCDFNNSNFRGATLSSASFERCKLTGANLTETKSMHAVFEETILADARLPGFSFRKAQLKQLDFQMADLRKCDFRQSVFEECSLRDANLAGCRFEGADLRGADLGGIQLVDARQFKGATISRDQAGQLLAELGLNVR